MPLQAHHEAIEQAMARYGGSFVKSLGIASIEADHGIHFGKALFEMVKAADPNNLKLLQEAFPNPWQVLEMSEADRRDTLYDAFPAILAKYVEMAGVVA